MRNVFPFGAACSNVATCQTGVQALSNMSDAGNNYDYDDDDNDDSCPTLANIYHWLSMCQHYVKSGMTFYLYMTLQSQTSPWEEAPAGSVEVLLFQLHYEASHLQSCNSLEQQ